MFALNPGYNRWATDPDGPHRLLVPIDHADAFEASLKALAPEDRVRYVTHTVARRETLPQIARRYGTSVAVLTKVNDLAGGDPAPGEGCAFRRPATSCRIRCCWPPHASTGPRPIRGAAGSARSCTACAPGRR